MKKSKKYMSAKELQRQNLLIELDKVKNDMNRVFINLENVVDEELIDCMIYELNASQIRYKVILSQVKAMDSYSEDKNPNGIRNLLKEVATS